MAKYVLWNIAEHGVIYILKHGRTCWNRTDHEVVVVLGPLGITWAHLCSLVFTWDNLGALWLTWFQLVSHGLT